jgi:hypothetical protein
MWREKKDDVKVRTQIVRVAVADLFLQADEYVGVDSSLMGFIDDDDRVALEQEICRQLA